MKKSESASEQNEKLLSPAEERKKRLAEALRQNLHRRKARSRGGDEKEAGLGAGTDENND